MSLINKEISDFKAYAFHGNDFKMVSKEEILGAVEEAANQLEINLSDEDRQLILDLMEKISNLDIDVDQLKEQAKAVYDRLVDMGIDLKSESFWQSVKATLNKVIDKIMSFFQ